MKPVTSLSTFLCGLCVFACAVGPAGKAHADTIAWTHWTTATAGTPGSASGTIGTLTVSYSGQNNGLLTNYPSWSPASSYTGGVVGNAPPASDNSVKLTGGSGITETITFSSTVADPILAIWSLGAPGNLASFNFTSAEPFTLVAGGKSAEFAGGPLTVTSTGVAGSEANGVVQFNGDFTSISFTTPTFENYYAFTVGEDATLTSQLGGGTSTTPEPSAFLLLGTGLLCAAGRFRPKSA